MLVVSAKEGDGMSNNEGGEEQGRNEGACRGRKRRRRVREGMMLGGALSQQVTNCTYQDR